MNGLEGGYYIHNIMSFHHRVEVKEEEEEEEEDYGKFIYNEKWTWRTMQEAWMQK